jgi:hypothetical protein
VVEPTTAAAAGLSGRLGSSTAAAAAAVLVEQAHDLCLLLPDLLGQF